MEADKTILNLAEKIENCKKCSFFKKDYFGFYSLNKNAKIMILMQNPGADNRRIIQEIGEIEKLENIEDKILKMREGLNDWILNKNRIFFKRFFDTLRDFELIYFDSFEQYVNSYKYLDDFYFTDLIKCRVETKKLDKEKDCYDRCFDSFLEFEMEYVKPKLIFAFSTRTWQTLKNRITMSIVNKENNDNLTLAKVHGYLFKAIDKDCFIIPLFHMSQRSFNNLLRDSYFDYLKEGLKKFTELKK